MQPNNDEHDGAQLNGLLREWMAPDMPPSLEQRVLRSCTPPRRTWWQLLFTGYIRVPVSLVYVLATLMAVTVWRFTAHAPPGPCVADTHNASQGRVSGTPPARCEHPLPGVC
jgi:hypothetical protein